MNKVKNFFNFNRRQERGVFVLCILLIVVIVINHYTITSFNNAANIDSENIEYLKHLKLANNTEFAHAPTYKNKDKIAEKKIPNKILPKLFNPNTVTTTDLLEMGLAEKVTNNIVKYRRCGGHFYKKEDLKKIYGLSDTVFTILEEYINIPKRPQTKKYQKQTSKNTVIEIADRKDYTKGIIKDTIMLGLNSSDSAQLVQIKGIGPFYASAIIKYRKKLGGYTDVSQLLDLYKMDSSKYENMRNHLFVDAISIAKININTADFKTILTHPYIDYETTKFIVNKRRELGQYAALYQLKDAIAMPDDKYQKLLPYLVID